MFIASQICESSLHSFAGTALHFLNVLKRLLDFLLQLLDIFGDALQPPLGGTLAASLGLGILLKDTLKMVTAFKGV